MGRALTVKTHDNPTPPAAPAVAGSPAADAVLTDAVRRVAEYLLTWGVGEASARRIAQTLDARIDPQVEESTKRCEAMLEALDRWTDELPDALGMPHEADRVALVVAIYGGRLLEAHPEAFERPAECLEAIRGHLDAWENGVLPKLEHQEMHRQPLGDLPAVLRGEFWSGTYRWVMPSSDRSVRSAAPTEPGDAAASTDSPAPGPAAT